MTAKFTFPLTFNYLQFHLYLHLNIKYQRIWNLNFNISNKKLLFLINQTYTL